ncbi:hypothetical protein SAY87_024494 [Trapa incisa]|uniref:Uncharacterized protein n=1 Tax=Trapa incisa TaxID=236973 RepID=A0AAN7G9R8_9MYRT|nr:hypothetical protein SAY87_024494 [Trapa incisa]
MIDSDTPAGIKYLQLVLDLLDGRLIEDIVDNKKLADENACHGTRHFVELVKKMISSHLVILASLVAFRASNLVNSMTPQAEKIEDFDDI